MTSTSRCSAVHAKTKSAPAFFFAAGVPRGATRRRATHTLHTATKRSPFFILLQMWIPCSRTNTPREISKPLLSPDTHGTRETQEIVISRTSPRTLLLHMPLTDLLRQIYRLADCRSGTLDSPDGRSFDQSAEAATTTARPPLSLLICPCLSLLSTDYCLSPCCHTLHRCSLTVRTLCLRKRESDHYPPAVTTRKS